MISIEVHRAPVDECTRAMMTKVTLPSRPISRGRVWRGNFGTRSRVSIGDFYLILVFTRLRSFFFLTCIIQSARNVEAEICSGLCVANGRRCCSFFDERLDDYVGMRNSLGIT